MLVLGALVVAALTTWEFTRSRQQIAFTGTIAAQTSDIAVEETVPLREPVSARRILVATVGLDSTVVRLDSSSQSIVLTPVADLGRPALTGAVRLPVHVPPAAVTVGNWSSEHPLVALLVYRAGTGAALEVWDLVHGGLISSNAITPPPLARGGQRTYALGNWRGQPALFIVDRDPVARVVRIQILAAASGFRQTLFNTLIHTGAGFPSRDWWLMVGSIYSPVGSSDLVFVTRFRQTGSGRLEVHALSGSSNFARFALERPSELSSDAAPFRRAVLGYRGGRAVWLSIDITRREASVLPLLPAELSSTPPVQLPAPALPPK